MAWLGSTIGDIVVSNGGQEDDHGMREQDDVVFMSLSSATNQPTRSDEAMALHLGHVKKRGLCFRFFSLLEKNCGRRVLRERHRHQIGGSQWCGCLKDNGLF